MKTPAQQEAYAEEMMQLTDQLSALVRNANGVMRIEDIPKQTAILAKLRKLIDNNRPVNDQKP